MTELLVQRQLRALLHWVWLILNRGVFGSAAVESALEWLADMPRTRSQFVSASPENSGHDFVMIQGKSLIRMKEYDILLT